MKDILSQLLKEAVLSCKEKHSWNIDIDDINFDIEIPKDRQFGDFATNLSFIIAKKIKSTPQEITTTIVSNIPRNNVVEKVETVNGYINFFVKDEYFLGELRKILQEKENYLREDIGNGKKVLIEFVSANPTGPLHVGHGRGAAIGDTLARLFSFFGFNTKKEYYINNSYESLQIENLISSVFARYKQLLGENVSFPEDGYFGNYIVDIAEKVIKKFGKEVEAFSDEIINFILEEILTEQKNILEKFGIVFDNFFSENDLYKEGEVQKVIDYLKEKNATYLKDGALWLKGGDDKDEVLIRSSKKPTYLASDIAYHKNKFERGYEYLVNIWGADHHWHIQRLKNAISLLGFEKDNIEILLMQMVNLYEDGKQIRLSKRSGNIITLEELIDEVTSDVAKFFFLAKDINSVLNFDLSLAKKQSNENPVWYVQYAYARICSIFRKANESNLQLSEDFVFPHDIIPAERLLIFTLIQSKDVIKQAFLKREIHKVCNYAILLAEMFHNFYEKCKVIDEKNLNQTNFRLQICFATKIIFSVIFYLLGISEKERM